MAVPPATGNTLLAPVRLTGNPKTDAMTIQRYLYDVYQTLALAQNIVGTQTEQTARITALEAQVADLTARVQVLEGP